MLELNRCTPCLVAAWGNEHEPQLFCAYLQVHVQPSRIAYNNRRAAVIPNPVRTIAWEEDEDVACIPASVKTNPEVKFP